MFAGSTLILLVAFVTELTSGKIRPNTVVHDERIERTWTAAFDFCRRSFPNGKLIEIVTSSEWNALTNRPINQPSLLWMGGNDFGRGTKTSARAAWRWLDGSTIDPTLTPWCSNPMSTDGHCLAYDSTSKCLRAESCERSLSVLCMPESETFVERSLRVVRQTSSSTCGTVYSGSYGSWWTYAMLLLNWFASFCFVNYLIYRLLMNKRAAFVIVFIVVLSLISIIAFAVLWALQCK